MFNCTSAIFLFFADNYCDVFPYNETIEGMLYMTIQPLNIDRVECSAEMQAFFCIISEKHKIVNNNMNKKNVKNYIYTRYLFLHYPLCAGCSNSMHG